jgi:hypothetical protein
MPPIRVAPVAASGRVSGEAVDAGQRFRKPPATLGDLQRFRSLFRLFGILVWFLRAEQDPGKWEKHHSAAARRGDMWRFGAWWLPFVCRSPAGAQ